MSYKRPYCANCKLIWGLPSMGRVLNCTHCGQPLALKSFNPWISAVAGIAVLAIGGLTLIVHQIPVIWIGGFLFGGSLIIRGYRQWLKILSLDSGRSQPKTRATERAEDKNHIVFTCGQCFTRLRVEKGKGHIAVTCPKCHARCRVTT